MAKIDFPNGNQSPFIDKDGRRWDFINGSWVKSFTWVEETQSVIDNIEYARFNGNWRGITYPVPTDVSTEPSFDPTKFYARQNDTWVEIDLAINTATLLLPPVDGNKYLMLNQAWVLNNETDLTVNYYDKATSDGRFAASSHQHTYNDGNLLGFGDLAGEAEAPMDGLAYVRNNAVWVPLSAALPTTQIQSNSITVIDPIITDDATFFFTPVAITITEVRSAAITLGGGASVLYNVLHGDMADGTGTKIEVFTGGKISNINTGQQDIPDNPNIPANSWVWLQIVDEPTATSFFHATVIYTENQ